MKLGIAGTGKIVQELLPVLDNMGLTPAVILGTERSRERTFRLAKQYNIKSCCFSYEQLLHGDIDTVYIAVPNHLHFAFAKTALESGKNAIVEKPICICSREFQELKRIAMEKQLFVLEAMTIPFMPAFRQLQEDIKKLGQIRIVNLNFSQYSSRYDDFQKGKVSPVFDPQKAGGTLLDMNVYNIWFAVSLLGKPKRSYYTANVQKGIDTSGVMVLDYEGTIAICTGAKDCRAENRSTIQGEKGTITLDQPTNQFTSYTIDMIRGEGNKVSYCAGNHRMQYEFAAFQKIIQDRDYATAEKLMDINEAVVELLEQGIQ